MSQVLSIHNLQASHGKSWFGVETCDRPSELTQELTQELTTWPTMNHQLQCHHCHQPVVLVDSAGPGIRWSPSSSVCAFAAGCWSRSDGFSHAADLPIFDGNLPHTSAIYGKPLGAWTSHQRSFAPSASQEKQQFPDGRFRVRNMLLAEKKDCRAMRGWWL